MAQVGTGFYLLHGAQLMTCIAFKTHYLQAASQSQIFASADEKLDGTFLDGKAQT
jgi:hypothetical protein